MYIAEAVVDRVAATAKQVPLLCPESVLRVMQQVHRTWHGMAMTLKGRLCLSKAC